MSQANSLIDGVPLTPPFSVDDVAALLKALVTTHSGVSRPAVVTGENQGIWIEVVSSSEWNLQYYDGTSDVLIGTINPAAHTWTAAGGGAITAADIPIVDAGNIITATDVEGALQENRAVVDAIENDYLSSSAIGTTVQAYDPNTLKANTSDTLTAGFNSTSYSLGTITGSNQAISPNYANGQHQHCTLNGSSLTGTLTINPPTGSTQVIIEVTNGGTGAVGATVSVTASRVEGLWENVNGRRYAFVLSTFQNASFCEIIPLQ